MIISESNSKGL